MSLFSDIKQFPRTFWLANTMELFERWAYYGMFAVLSIYLTDPVSKGGLGFTQEQRGLMQGIVTGVLYLLPVFGGAIADRFGFRKVLLAAFVTLISGYFAMGQFHRYAPVFAAFLIVAVGGAIFKPVIVGTVSKTTNKNTETVGFGIFYMIVNIGGFIGPWAASKMRDLDWHFVFFMCSAVIIVNLILLIFYREPSREKQTGSIIDALREIAKNTLIVLKDFKFVLFLIIIVGFWTMYMQLFFTVPVYIAQWVDTSIMYKHFGFLRSVFGSIEEGKGLIRPEMMINIPALTIIFFQLIMSSVLKKVRPVSSMVGGIFVVVLGMGQLYYHVNGWYVALSLVIFAFGEMASSPRIQEYISSIAPSDKVGLYMGYSFLPVAGGNILGGLLSGSLYGSFSDKYNLLRDYLVTHTGQSMQQIRLTDDAILFKQSMEKLQLSSADLTRLLYETYHPGIIWFIFGSIGLLTAILLFLYNRFILDKTD